MPNKTLVIHDSPIRLVIRIIALSLIFSLLYLAVALISSNYPAFDDGVLLELITYDIIVFTVLVILQQIIALILLMQWLKRYYTIDTEGITLIEGVFFRKNTTIPASHIRTITRSQDLIARQLHYGTITIELINRPEALVMPYLTHPDQVIKHLNIQESQIR